MVNVDDLRLPLAPRVLDHARLDHVEHVGVAVVVVADVLLVELRRVRQLVRRPDVFHVPVGDHLLAVGIDRRPQHDDDVFEKRLRRGLVRCAQQVICEQRRVLWTCDFRRMQPAVDVDERLAVTCQLLRLCIGEPLRMRQTLPDLTVPIDSRQVVRRRDQREVHRPSLRGLPRFHQANVLARGCQLSEVLDRLIVGRELVVRSRFEPEDGRGRGHRRSRLRDGPRGDAEREEDDERNAGCHGRGDLIRSGRGARIAGSGVRGAAARRRGTPVPRQYARRSSGACGRTRRRPMTGAPPRGSARRDGASRK